MTERELREIKRHLRPDRCNIGRVVGCFVNSSKQIVARISQSLALGDSVVSERLIGVLKKTLSGSLGSSLNQIDFSTRQVAESEEHKLLMALRNSGLSDAGLLESFYQRVTESVEFEGNYIILLANDVYDVMTKHSDGEAGESSERFSYLICAVCPLKDSPEALTFKEADSLFHTTGAGGVLGGPELGFTFPAFDGRSTNIYGALYYTRSGSESYPEFARRVLDSKAPMPPKHQRAAFCEELHTALSEECDLGLVKAVQATVAELIESHKESRDPEPLMLTKHTVRDVLVNCGVDNERAEKLGEAMDADFGVGAAVSPKNIVSTTKFEVTMPEVKINISPDKRDLVSVRDMGGEKFLMIKVTGPVEVNGINISLDSGDRTES